MPPVHTPSRPASQSPAALPETLSPTARQAWLGLALATGYRTRAVLTTVLKAMPPCPVAGREPFVGGAKVWTQDRLLSALVELKDARLIMEHPTREGYWSVALAWRTATYWTLVHSGVPFEVWREALLDAEGIHNRSSLYATQPPQAPRPSGARAWWAFPNLDAACAVTRLTLLSGQPPEALEPLRQACGWNTDWATVLDRALHDVLDETLLPCLHPLVQIDALCDHLSVLTQHWNQPGILPTEAALATVRQRAEATPETLAALRQSALPQLQAEYLLLRGQFDAAVAALEVMARAPDPSTAETGQAWQQAAQAYQRFRQGAWQDSIGLYETALGRLKTLSQKRKGLLPPTIGLAYALALMATRDPAQQAKAIKHCLSESGKRQPSADNAWGLLAWALQMRSGQQRREIQPFTPHSHAPYLHPLDFWRWMARAWLKDTPGPETSFNTAQHASARWFCDHLRGLGLSDLAEQMEGAILVLGGSAPPAHFMVNTGPEGWRSTLSALAAIGTPTVGSGGGTATPVAAETRLLWIMSINPYGAVSNISPMEQKRGLRGWNKAREVSLTKLSRSQDLDPHDARVALAIRTHARDRSLRLDLAVAAAALVGHPHLEFDDAPGVNVLLTEGNAELDVQDLGDQLRITLNPLPRWSDPQADRQEPQLWISSAAEQKEAEALRVMSVVRDGPQQARLVRLNPAQTQAAQLIGAGLEVPRAALPELEEVLRRLGAHFQIHSDASANAREVPAESRLRAELTPEDDGVHLRLVVAPFGPEGPRVNPGSGRRRLVATLDGETLSVQRDLVAETSFVETVLDACPMLTPLPPRAPAQWQLETPELTLALLERLHTLNAVMALDWPKGKAIRVDNVGVPQLKVSVKSGQEWLSLQGGLQLDERLVMSLSRVLDWSRTQQSRFVPLGEGRYLALTEELRSRLDELASVAQDAPRAAGPGADAAAGSAPQAQVPAVAALWLDHTLRGADVDDRDGTWLRRLESLMQLHQLEPTLPSTLQAQLRPYQVEGFQWAMRLAHGGLGACLADDMGLGKTLQALAVLLARAAGGPALVIAPTSLIGNWLAEARRFAPSLRLHNYAEGDPQGQRQALLERLGPLDVVLVSYQLQQIDNEAFAAPSLRWHTLVLDEAQAIKNAAAKRSQAVHELQADFRLALSGTPIENRLTELWSIMRVCNPGLLGSLTVFNSRFAVPIERDRHRGAQRTLRKLIAPFILRRTKAQVLDDLPPRTELTLLVQGDATEQAHYEALRRQALQEAEEALQGNRTGQAHLNILAQLTRLRRAACDPRLVTPELSWVGAKVRAFGELAAELAANGHKALVFSQFVDFLGLLKDQLDGQGLRHQYLDGATPAAERTRRVAAFQAGEGDFFLISLKAGGFGLNLTVADYVVIADPWWNPAAEDQASGRAHRIGQQRPVTVYRLVHQGTLEEKIVALHQDKRDLADRVLEGSEHSGGLPTETLLALLQEAMFNQAP